MKKRTTLCCAGRKSLAIELSVCGALKKKRVTPIVSLAWMQRLLLVIDIV
jgi:hypothetical protein